MSDILRLELRRSMYLLAARGLQLKRAKWQGPSNILRRSPCWLLEVCKVYNYYIEVRREGRGQGPSTF